MVLLGVVGDEIVDPGDILQVGLENMEHGRLDGVDERGLVPSPDEIGVIARPVGERDEGVEEPPVEVRRSDIVNGGYDLSGFHEQKSPRISALIPTYFIVFGQKIKELKCRDVSAWRSR